MNAARDACQIVCISGAVYTKNAFCSDNLFYEIHKAMKESSLED